MEIEFNDDGTVTSKRQLPLKPLDMHSVTLRIPPIMFNRMENHVNKGSLGASNQSEFITRCIGKTLNLLDGY
jgi:hypothetical protein